MARKKVAYRKRHQNRFSMFLVTLVVLMIMVVVEEVRAEEIEQYRKYTRTKRYVEEVAKDKLGLVYEGEILFKEDH